MSWSSEPSLGLTVVLLNSSPTIATPAGTLIGRISSKIPVLTKIVAGALLASSPKIYCVAYLIVLNGLVAVNPAPEISCPDPAT